MILKKVNTIKLSDNNLHIMRLDGKMVVFHKDSISCRRIILNSEFDLVHSFHPEQWFFLAEFIDSSYTKAYVQELTRDVYDVKSLKWFQRK